MQFIHYRSTIPVCIMVTERTGYRRCFLGKDVTLRGSVTVNAGPLNVNRQGWNYAEKAFRRRTL